MQVIGILIRKVHKFESTKILTRAIFIFIREIYHVVETTRDETCGDHKKRRSRINRAALVRMSRMFAGNVRLVSPVNERRDKAFRDPEIWLRNCIQKVGPARAYCTAGACSRSPRGESSQGFIPRIVNYVPRTLESCVRSGARIE